MASIDLSRLPRSSLPELKRGMPPHLGTWSVQYDLRALMYEIVVDGDFGPQTEEVVKRFQSAMGLRPDGVVGIKTNRTLLELRCGPIYDLIPKLPGMILESISQGETSFWPGAMNWTSTSKPRGTDVLKFQRRVYAVTFAEPWPNYNAIFDPAAVKRAARTGYQARLLGTELESRHNRYFGQAGAPTHEKAWRLAIFAHNRGLSSADALAFVKTPSPYWTSQQQWVVDLNLTFDDGAPVRTPYEHAQRYALGAPEHHHEGLACRLVTSWT